MPPAHIFFGDKNRSSIFYLTYLRARDKLRLRAFNPTQFTTPFHDKGLTLKEWRTLLLGSYVMSGPIASDAASEAVLGLQQALPSRSTPVLDRLPAVEVAGKKKRKRGEAANVNNFMAIECKYSEHTFSGLF
jgi:hypothetical protein